MAVPGTSPAAYAAPIDNVDAWLSGLVRPASLIEMSTLLACFVLAAGLVWLSRRALGVGLNSPILFGRRVLDGVLFPLLLLALAYAGRAILVLQEMPLAIFRVAIPALLALVAIRVGVKVLQAAFKETPLVLALERTISWLAWLSVVLWVSGLLPLMLVELDAVTWRVGGSTMSVRTMIEGALTAVAVLIVALWISSAIESRLLQSAAGNELSLRKAVSNGVRALLVGVGLLVSLSAVGIDLTALSVLGGAIGVGVGFGLQKLAASYVSGFVMLAERSVRIGDQVRIDGFEGRITDIKARYTIVRALSGRESVVPNEMFISNRVENLSLTDTRMVLTSTVSVSYDSDVDLVMRLLVEAAGAEPRVLSDPVPAVLLNNFGADGLEFTLSYWIDDPQNGQNNARSTVNLALFRAFQAHGIEIPFPQRVVRVAPADAGAPEAGALAKSSSL